MAQGEPVKTSQKTESARARFYPEVRIRLVQEKPFFGRGPARLLGLIDETQSVRRACQKMDMSYSKAWKLIKEAEEALGCVLVERRHGGSHGGSSALTPEGKAMLESYSLFEKMAQEQVREIFDRCFASPLRHPRQGA